MRVGHVHKYADRSVAVHALTETGAPECGSRVDRDALENYEGTASDVTCRRCLVRIGAQA